MDPLHILYALACLLKGWERPLRTMGRLNNHTAYFARREHDMGFYRTWSRDQRHHCPHAVPNPFIGWRHIGVYTQPHVSPSSWFKPSDSESSCHIFQASLLLFISTIGASSSMARGDAIAAGGVANVNRVPHTTSPHERLCETLYAPPDERSKPVGMPRNQCTKFNRVTLYCALPQLGSPVREHLLAPKRTSFSAACFLTLFKRIYGPEAPTKTKAPVPSINGTYSDTPIQSFYLNIR